MKVRAVAGKSRTRRSRLWRPTACPQFAEFQFTHAGLCCGLVKSPLKWPTTTHSGMWESDTVAPCNSIGNDTTHIPCDTTVKARQGHSPVCVNWTYTLYLLKQNKNDNSVFIIRCCINPPNPLHCSTHQLSRYLNSQIQYIAAVGTAWSLLGSNDWL